MDRLSLGESAMRVVDAVRGMFEAEVRKIGGSPEWKSGDGPWVRVDAGSIIHRPYGGAEGKRPGDEPMLALYAWLYR